MTPDLRSALESSADAEARRHEPADLDAEVRWLTARVRRRRTLRASAAGLAAVAAVAVGAVAVQALDGPDRPPADPVRPATRATTAPDPTPSATPAPAVTPTEPAVLGEVTVHPLLPTAEPLRAGMLESATAGWRLVTFDVRPAIPDAPSPVLYLVAPQGERYEVPTPFPLTDVDEEAGDGAGLVDWQPGSTIVLTFGSSGHLAVRDLLTGQVLSDIPVPSAQWVDATLVGDGSTDVLITRRVPDDEGVRKVESVERLTQDGGVVAVLGAFQRSAAPSDEPLVLSPDRRSLVLDRAAGPQLVRAADLSVVGPLASPYPDDPGRCAAWTWWDDARVVLRCAPEGVVAGTGQELVEAWLVPVAGSAAAVPLGDVEQYVPAGVAGGRLVVLGTQGWTATDESGAVTPLARPVDATVGLVGVHGDTLHLRVTGVEDLASNLVSVDVVTGETTVLVPTVTPTHLTPVPRGVRG